jgi:hypothetical protein
LGNGKIQRIDLEKGVEEEYEIENVCPNCREPIP